MRLINRDVDYSVRALAYAALRSPGMVTVSGMQEKVGVSRPFLRKILQKLNKAGILGSQKGRGGGFRLARSPERITLGEVIEVFQGPVKTENCMFERKLCIRHRSCRLRDEMGRIESRLERDLGRITLKTLAGKK